MVGDTKKDYGKRVRSNDLSRSHSLRFMRRGQLTLFVLIGFVIVMGVVALLFFWGKGIVSDVPTPKSPRIVLEKCIADSVQPSINAVLDYGGLIAPALSIPYKNHSYNYLCYTGEFYTKCYNYYPMLNRIAEEQIRQNTVELVDECFDDLLDDYESRGFDVTRGELEYSVEVVPGSVRLRIKKEMSTTTGESTDVFDAYGMKIPSDLYELIEIARNVVNSEAEFCFFENNGFMVLYPLYNMSRIDYDGSKIYEVENRKTKEVFRFATRSCAYAPGF